MQKQISQIISYAVFVFALIIILINLVSLVFPALIVTQINETIPGENTFELGSWTVPLITTNIGILVFGILFYKNKIPSVVKKYVNFIYSFEVSRNVALLVFVILLFGYIGYSMQDIGEDEADTWGDYTHLLGVIEKWPEMRGGNFATLEVLHVKNFLIKSSLVLFNNPKVVPFFESIVLVILTYFFTVKITHNRFAGLVSMIVLIQSYTFLRFDTLMTYANDWTLFYLLSLYLIYVKWPLSPISYFASILSKPLSAAFLPMTLFFIYRAEVHMKKKIRTFVMYVGIVIVFAVVGLTIENPLIVADEYNYVDFWAAFTTWAFQLRFDTIFLLFILPLTVCLFLKSRSGFPQADSAIVLIAGVILAMPLLAGLTGYNVHPYRYVPLMVFFAIGVGMLFAKKVKQEA